MTDRQTDSDLAYKCSKLQHSANLYNNGDSHTTKVNNMDVYSDSHSGNKTTGTTVYYQRQMLSCIV